MQFPRFQPHPLVRGGHAQTLIALVWQGRLAEYAATPHTVQLDDGDQLVLHDDRPDDWREGQRAALLVHGLAGSHASPYMVRIASKLNARGIRTFRMDLRGCGAGLRLARRPYHSGRSEDALAALLFIARLCPGSPIAALGFSLGANIVLKLLGEVAASPPIGLDRGAAVGPPVDLLSSVQSLQGPIHRWYDRYFGRLLTQRVSEWNRAVPDSPEVKAPTMPRGIYEFDSWYTAPVCGFGTAENYYRRCSSGPLLPRIQVPTLILSARDDPLVPIGPLEKIAVSSAVCVHVTNSGGHLGYIGRRAADLDQHWMDWRVVDWVLAP